MEARERYSFKITKKCLKSNLPKDGGGKGVLTNGGREAGL